LTNAGALAGDRTRAGGGVIGRKPTCQKQSRTLPAVIPASRAVDGLPSVSNALKEIDKKISAATSSELSRLLTARGQVIAQDEHMRDGIHSRRREICAFAARVLFSVLAIGVGTALVANGFVFPGFFLLAGSAACYIPEYVDYFSILLENDASPF
jgi:hypothetical protein